ncbi:Hint domain-containing protein [Parasulfitobacter algicola]|uniref:Hint domain-containing protein n=1 Tax=Parasulfitobacter algicola TaxID=2614809 RepID=UPI0031B56C7D
MVPSQTYEFTSEGNIRDNSRPYAQFACFTLRMMIATPQGNRRIETLTPGDLVTTRDHGDQPVRWIGQRTVPAIRLWIILTMIS